jgi:hypothetical protein
LLALGSAHVLRFYCKTKDKDRDSFVALARTLIGQALLQDDSVLPYIFEQSATSGERPLSTITLSKKILETCLKSLDNVYIVIDGLDECESVERRVIATWFKDKTLALQDEGINIRCLFSCQSDEVTSKVFKNIPSFDIGGDGLARDIRTFCTVEGMNIKETLSLPDHDVHETVDKVCKEARSKIPPLFFLVVCSSLSLISFLDMFLYAKLVMGNLSLQTKLSNLRKELEPGVFPQGIKQA